jgi:hypothetical protein
MSKMRIADLHGNLLEKMGANHYREEERQLNDRLSVPL